MERAPVDELFAAGVSAQLRIPGLPLPMLGGQQVGYPGCPGRRGGFPPRVVGYFAELRCTLVQRKMRVIQHKHLAPFPG